MFKHMSVVFMFVLFAASSIHLPTLYAANTNQNDSYQTSPTGSTSLNWAGYTTSSEGPYTAAQGSWIVPLVTDTTPGRADAAWVGIGGRQTHDLVQAGTEAVIDNGGQVQYDAWYELLPDVSIPVDLKVSPGNSITTSITEIESDQWQIMINNTTTGESFKKIVTYHSSHKSAEWIEERLSTIDRSYFPLDNFGSVMFTGGTATENGTTHSLKDLTLQPVTMAQLNGTTLATPTPLNPKGGFTVIQNPTLALASKNMDPTPLPQQDRLYPWTTPGILIIRVHTPPTSGDTNESDSNQVTNISEMFTLDFLLTHYFNW